MSGLGVPLDPEDLPSSYRPRSKRSPQSPERQQQRRSRRTASEYHRRRAIQEGVDVLRDLLVQLERNAGNYVKTQKLAALSRVDVMVEAVRVMQARKEGVSKLQEDLVVLERDNDRLRRLCTMGTMR